LPALLRHLEEPRLAASFQNLAAARLAAGEVTVVLSGGGGDELFAGYPWRYAPVLEAETPEAFALALGKVWSRVLPPEEKGFWADEGKRLVAQGDPEAVLRRFSAEGGDVPPLHRILSVEARTFLPAYCVLEDKLHMAMGAEVRSPLLDHELLDWARRLPVSFRLGADGSGKFLLRKALAGRLPEGVLEGPKQGFVPPLMSWCAEEPWKGFLQETLLKPPLTARGLIRPEAVRKDVEAVVAGSPAPLQRVWTCLAFELWCREFLDA
jgi:asparagine synthase (glutamine-hydrolysing)